MALDVLLHVTGQVGGGVGEGGRKNGTGIKFSEYRSMTFLKV
jgi:hypothetical protein